METRLFSKSAVTDHHIHEAVGRKIEACPYGFMFKNVTWCYAKGRLTLRGSAPSFYLKQVLQELLRDMDQLEQIVNRVDAGLRPGRRCFGTGHGRRRRAGQSDSRSEP